MSEIGFVDVFEEACCEGQAVRATADQACQLGCIEKYCGEIEDEYGLGIEDMTKCRAGIEFEACKGVLSNDCDWLMVDCDFASNELFDGDGTVPLDSLKQREWCGQSKSDSLIGSEDEAGGPDPAPPIWSNHRVELDPSQTTVLVEWTSTTWGSHAVMSHVGGGASFRIGTCRDGRGECVGLTRMVLYGGNIEIQGILASNLVIQLSAPVELAYDGTANVDVDVGALPMLLTYEIDGYWIAWEAVNSNRAWGTVDPENDLFVLDKLEFSGVEDDIRVSLTLDIWGGYP